MLSPADFLARFNGGGGGGFAPQGPLLQPSITPEQIQQQWHSQGGGAPGPRIHGSPMLAPPVQHHGESILGQIGHAFSGIPGGLLHLGSEIGSTALNVPRAIYHAATGQGSLGDIGKAALLSYTPMGALAGGAATAAHQTLPGFNPQEQAQLTPAGTEAYSSFGRTGYDVSHPGEFVKAYQEGRIVPKVLEDVGNLSLAAAPAGELLGMAGLEGAGQAVERAGHLGGRMASMGTDVSLWRGLGQRAAAATDPMLQDLLAEHPTLRTGTTGRLLDPVQRAMSKMAVDASTAERTMGQNVKANIAAAAKGLTPAEQEAAAAIVRGEAHLAPMAETLRQKMNQVLASGPSAGAGMHVSEAQMGSVLEPHQMEFHSTSPEGAQLAHAVVTGTADPASAAKVQRLADTYRTSVEEPIQSAALKGVGQTAGPLRPEQLGDEMLPEHAARVNDLVQQMRGPQGFTQDQYDQYQAELHNPANYPARWRPLMFKQARVAQLATDTATAIAGHDPQGAAILHQFASDVPRTPADLRAQGVDPHWLPSGESPLHKIGRVSQGSAQTSESVGPQQRLRTEHVRTSGEIRPTGPGDIAQMASNQLRDVIRNQTVMQAAAPAVVDAAGHILRDPATGLPQGGFSVKPDQILDPQQMADVLQAAQQKAHIEQLPPEMERAVYNRQLAQAMAAQGWEPWDVRNPHLDIAPDQVSDSTVWMPRGLADRFRSYYEPKNPTGFLAMTNWLNQKWKGMVLPFSVRWQLHDFIGNNSMPWLSGRIDPLELQMGARRAQGVAEARPEVFPRGLHKYGLALEDQHFLQGTEPRGGFHPIEAVREKSFALNSAINSWHRNATYLISLERRLANQGFDMNRWDWTTADLHDPQVAQAMQDAVKQTNQIHGDYGRLTVGERRYMRAVLPFYTWNRHVLSFVARLALDDPARLLAITRIGSVYGADDIKGLPAMFQNTIGLPGGMRMNVASFNPFAAFEDSPALTPEGFLQNTSPAIKLGAAAAFGADLGAGGAQFTRPPNTGDLTSTGRPGITPLYRRPTELLYALSQMFPQGRALLNVLPTGDYLPGDVAGGPILRYHQGSPILTKVGSQYRPIESNLYTGPPRLSSALGAFGVPLPYSAQPLQQAVQRETAAKNRRVKTVKSQQKRKQKISWNPAP